MSCVHNCQALVRLRLYGLCVFWSSIAVFPLFLSPSQVEKYMESLPPECVPTLGTEGETYRRKQCFLQLPVYDFSLDACHKMTDLEKKRYVKFTSKRSENFFGAGTLKLQGSEENIVCVQTYTIINCALKYRNLFLMCNTSPYRSVQSVWRRLLWGQCTFPVKELVQINSGTHSASGL